MFQNSQPQNLSDVLGNMYLLVHEYTEFSGSQLDLIMHLWSAVGWPGTSAGLSGLAQMSWGWLLARTP